MLMDDEPIQPFDDGQTTLNRSLLDNPRVLSAPFWGELRIFLAVAKAKSFSGAAEELHMSTPTVSRQVRRLQDVIGSQLFVTTQNSIQLTPKGLELAKLLSVLDERLFAISRDLATENRDAEGTVRVSATEALTGLFVAPAMTAFHARYPGIRLHLQNPSNMTNFKENNTDIMVSFMPGGGAVTTQPCGWVHLIPVASRSYIEQYGMPTRDNLESHTFLDTEYYKGKTPLWQPWQEAVARGTVAHDCDNSFAYGLLIRAGHGIGLLASYALSEATLVPIDLGIHIAVRLHLLAMTERLQSRPVRVVYEWLSDVFGPDSGWFGPGLNLAQLPTETLQPVVKGALLET
jgi:DNA-binding transcriptional LysR family regulator